jgi:hypothetical protein
MADESDYIRALLDERTHPRDDDHARAIDAELKRSGYKGMEKADTPKTEIPTPTKVESPETKRAAAANDDKKAAPTGRTATSTRAKT